jgi:hypothetical protein
MQKKSLLEITKIELSKDTIDHYIAPTADHMVPYLTVLHDQMAPCIGVYEPERTENGTLYPLPKSIPTDLKRLLDDMRSRDIQVFSIDLRVSAQSLIRYAAKCIADRDYDDGRLLLESHYSKQEIHEIMSLAESLKLKEALAYTE